MGTITIAALGAANQITLAAWNAICQSEHLFLQTDQHPSAGLVRTQGLSYTSMDDLYESAQDFDALNAAIAERLTSVADAVYAVVGRGCGTQLAAIEAHAQTTGHAVTVLPGIGYAQAAFARWCCSDAPYVLTSAARLPTHIDPAIALCIEELDTRIRAGEVKLALSEYYPDDHPVQLGHIGTAGHYEIASFPLYELDRQTQYDATTVLLVPPITQWIQKDRYGYHDLEAILERLRAPGGCPWDRKQTHVTLKKPLLEECYEVLDAIDRADDDALCEELGDVLLQCFFHAQIATEQARFTSRDVTTGIVKKLIYRHPHIFKDAQADTADAVLVQWETLKKKEKHFENQSAVLRAVPRNLPALMRSSKIQSKAAQVGFDWKNAQDAMFKIQEELEELQQAIKQDTNTAEELGDLLFAVVNVARLLRFEPELLLSAATDKFEDRFCKMELLAKERGNTLEQLSLEELDVLWNTVKSTENKPETP